MKTFPYTSKALMHMSILELCPMPVTRWWSRVSRPEHASLMLNGYIVTQPRGDSVWCVKLTAKGKARLGE